MSVPPRIGLISNPTSGHNRERFAALREQLDSCPGVTHRVTSDPRAISPALQEFREAGLDTLAINGGDGTVAAVLGALLQRDEWRELPSVVILPAGTANMTAGDVGMRGSLRGAVRRFCAWASAGAPPAPVRLRPLLRVNTNDGWRHGFFIGGGAIIAGTDYAHQSLHSRGLRDDFSLALGVARSIWGIARRDPRFLQRTPFQIEASGHETLAVEGLLLAASTLERLAFGMRPFWGEGPGAARLTILEHGCRHFVPSFLRIIAGRPGRGCVPRHGYHSLNFDALRLHSSGTLNFDGELLPVDGEVRIEATRPLAFLRP